MILKDFTSTKIPVVEIFTSISGEGISQGQVVTFVRVAGCNLRCSYCDTTYSYNEEAEGIKYLSPEEIASDLKKLGCKDVICTGGEPLEELKSKRYLPLYLAAKGFNVRIESNGSCPVYSSEELRVGSESFNKGDSVQLLSSRTVEDRFGLQLFYALDVKCPESGMASNNIFEDNFSKLRSGDEIKFVVASEVDIKYALGVIQEFKDIFAEKSVVIDFSPVFGKIEPKDLAQMLVEENNFFTHNNIKVRLSLQIHKFIWNPETRGV